MPVRSINLRLVIPRSHDAASSRQALWTTHAAVNAAARYYEGHLLRLRAESYETPLDGLDEVRKVSHDEVQAIAVAVGREAQRTNLDGPGAAAATDKGPDAEIVSVLQALYRQIIPAETGATSAQNANAFLSPLTDPLSQGFGAATEKLSRLPPNWLSIADDDPDVLDAARAWLSSAAAAAWQSDTGSPAGWLRAARIGRPDWPQLFRRYLEQLTRRVAEGAEAVVARARALGVLPLFPPYFSPKMTEAGGRVTPWDRLAFRLAVAHLLSWEAWCRRAAEQHAGRLARLEEYRRNDVTPEVEQLLEKVPAYEHARAAELSRLGLGPGVYTIRPRQLRGWPELREAWLKSSRTTDQLRALSARQQARRRRRFGDAQVFMWLAEPAQHDLWTGTDVVTIAATLNAMQALVDRSRETATMTMPDAQLHPRAAQWSAKGDSNLRPYRIFLGADDQIHARLRLLRARPDDGRLEDIEGDFLLASSGQFRSPTFTQRGKKDFFEFANESGEKFAGEIGSGDLLFDRAHLQRADVHRLECGDIGPAWLKLALELDQTLPAGWTPEHARFARYFRAAPGTVTKTENELREGARVLSVNLGLRTLAACPVFALQHSCPKHALGFPVVLDTRTLWAVHERSFHLTLSGEQPSNGSAVAPDSGRGNAAHT